jgi:hypothetical protein
MNEATYTLTQRRLWGGRQTLTLDGNMLKAVCRQGLSFQEYRFELRGLLPDPVRIRHIPIVRIAGAALLAACTILCIGFAIRDLEIARKGDDALALFLFALLLLVLAAAAWMSATKRTVNAIVFRGPGGQAALWPDRPNREEFDQFMGVLTARIRKAQDYEQNVLRHLRLAGVIDDWQYDQAVEFVERQKDQAEEW